MTKLVLVDVVPRYEKDGSARIRDFMSSGIDGFESLDEAADAVAAYLPYRTKPRSPEGLKKNLRLRDGRWYWHWDPAFLTVPKDDQFVRMDKLEQAVIDLTIPILLIRGKLSDVVSEEGVKRLPGEGAPRRVRRVVARRTHRRRRRQRRVLRSRGAVRQPVTRWAFNFLEAPELPAPQVSEAQADGDPSRPLRDAGTRHVPRQPTGQELRRDRRRRRHRRAC